MEAALKDAKATDASGVHLWLVLWKTFKSLHGHVDHSIAGLGLCLSDFGVMEALLHKGPLPIKALGEKVLLTSGSITTAVDRLEQRGWVERGNDPHDRRSRIVRLTGEGRKTIEALFANHQRDMENAVAILSSKDRITLTSLLRQLGRDAQAQLDTPGRKTDFSRSDGASKRQKEQA
jgi:MarR family transcriptional regulator, 2-MHQ and catechol-resistance regulon repressor